MQFGQLVRKVIVSSSKMAGLSTTSVLVCRGLFGSNFWIGGSHCRKAARRIEFSVVFILWFYLIGRERWIQDDGNVMCHRASVCDFCSVGVFHKEPICSFPSDVA
jgi:hypothetical protein